MVPPGRDAAICDATLALLAEVGYDRMSMDAVAARAHASKATIYRRWPGKRELVMEAVHRRHGSQVELVGTGSLRGDLLAGLRAMAARSTDCDDGELMVGVLRAMHQSPELGDCLRGQVLDGKRAIFAAVVDRAAARGELDCPVASGPDDLTHRTHLTRLTELAHEVAGALWVQRVLVVGAAVDDAFISHVVDDVLIPLLGRTRRPANDLETP